MVYAGPRLVSEDLRDRFRAASYQQSLVVSPQGIAYVATPSDRVHSGDLSQH